MIGRGITEYWWGGRQYMYWSGRRQDIVRKKQDADRRKAGYFAG
jgi:hypothetical protein